MWNVITPIITSLITLIGVLYTTRSAHDKTITEVKTQLDLTTQELRMTNEGIKKDIQSLERKQDKHNSLIERMYCAEKTIELIEERQKVANHRLDDLEKQASV